MICPFDSSRVGWLGQSFSCMVVIYLILVLDGLICMTFNVEDNHMYM